MALTKRIYVDGETIITAQNLNDIQDEIIAHESNKVPITRTVNSKALSANITLSASDVGAVPTTRTVNSKALSSNITLTAGDIGYNSSTTYTSGSVGKAVSDLNGAISDLQTFEAYRVTGTISSSSLSLTKTGITTNMIPVCCEFGTPSNVLSGYTITTTANTITFSNITLLAATTVDIFLIKAN